MGKIFFADNTANATEVDTASIQPFPKSTKIYIQGSRPDIQVPMREIALAPTLVPGSSPDNPNFTDNQPVRVYDTSGVYSDQNATIDVRKGLPYVREQWIEERKDTVQLVDESSDYTRQRSQDPKSILVTIEDA